MSFPNLIVKVSSVMQETAIALNAAATATTKAAEAAQQVVDNAQVIADTIEAKDDAIQATNDANQAIAELLTEIQARLQDWIQSDAFRVTDADTITSGGVTLPQNIVWPDEKAGTLSNLVVSGGLITSLRYNYDGTTKYATRAIDYSNQFPIETFTFTGF